MPHLILTPAQVTAFEAAVTDALSFGSTGVVTGLTNGVAYRAISYSLSEPFLPVAAPVVATNGTLPSIGGVAHVGQTLAGSAGVWTGSAPISYAYQWRRNGAAISGATAASYVLVAGDLGATIALSVVATNPAGSSAPALSAGIGPVTNASALFLNDTFSGEATNTDLSAHTSDSGHTWARHPGFAANAIRMVSSGTIFAAVGGQDHLYVSNAIPPGPDVEVSAVVVPRSLILNNFFNICARLNTTQVTGYFAIVAMRSNGERVISLNRRVNGTTTALGVSTLVTDWVIDVAKLLTLRVVGDQITVLLDGVVVVSATDTAIPDAGRVGVGGFQGSGSSASTATTGVHFTSLNAGIYVPPAAQVTEAAPENITFTQSPITEASAAGTEAGSFI
jgi:hypothetical protein